MQDEELSKQLASAGGIGIGDQIYQKLKQVTEPHIKSYP
jgi:Rod binding domain-containing protein